MQPIPLELPILKAYAQFLKNIRSYLDQQGFLEIETPYLNVAGAFESSIDPIVASWKNGSAELHTSPEISMKRVIAKIQQPVFQICRCFRDDLESPYHGKEFTMLEFYQTDSNYLKLVDSVKGLILTLAATPPEFETTSIHALFQKVLDLDLTKVPQTKQFFEALKTRQSFEVLETDTWEDLFFRCMFEKIESSLNPLTATVIINYPKAVSPLSKEIANTLFAERFEIYWRGIELCNGCTEQNDISLLEQRYTIESKLRLGAMKTPHPRPQLLFDSAPNLKNIAGVAIGLDRLFRCLQS